MMLFSDIGHKREGKRGWIEKISRQEINIVAMGELLLAFRSNASGRCLP
jgi:hypothetical protein